jgi:hypothetical protein
VEIPTPSCQSGLRSRRLAIMIPVSCRGRDGELRPCKMTPKECVRSAGERQAGASKRIQDGFVKRK